MPIGSGNLLFFLVSVDVNSPHCKNRFTDWLRCSFATQFIISDVEELVPLLIYVGL